MSDAVELATAYVSLVPTVKGIQGAVASELGAPLEQAASKAGDNAGSGFAATFIKAAAAGAVAAGVAVGAALVTGMGQEKLNDKLAAQLDLAGPEAARAGEIAGSLYANAYGDSLEEVNTAVGAVISSISGMRKASASEVKAASEDALNFAATYDIDVQRAVSSVGQLMKTGLAKDSSQAFDLIAAASSKVPAALREDILDASDEYSQFFASLGYSGEESFALLVDAADKGMFGIDKIGDSIKEFTIRSTDMSASSKAAYKAIGLDAETMANQILAGGDKASGATQKIIDGLLSIKDPAAQGQAAIALFGTPLEDLNVTEIPQFLKALQGGSKTMDDFGGAADRMGATLNDNAATNLEAFKRQAIQTFVDVIGGQALPALNEGAAFLATNFGPAVAAIPGLFDQLVAKGTALTSWASENRGAVTALAIVLGTVLAPAIIGLGVSATVSAAKQAAAWVLTSTAGARSIAVQIAGFYRLAAGWVLAGAAAIKSGAETVAIWALLQADAIRGAAAQVAAHARMAAAWVVSRAQAVASGAVIVAQWVAMQAAALASAAVTVAANVRAAASFAIQRAAMLAGVVAMGVVRGAVIAWTVVQWLLNAALTANPIGLVVAGIALLVAGLVLAWKRSETFRNVVTTALRVVAAVAGAVWNGIKAGAQAVWSFISAYVRVQLNIVRTVLNLLRTGATIVWNAIKAGAQALWSFVSSYARGQINAVRAVLTALRAAAAAVWSAIRSAATSAFNAIKSAASSAINAAKAKIGEIKTKASGVLNEVRNLFSGSALYGAGQRLMQGLANGVAAKIAAVVQKVRDAVAKIKAMLPGSPIKEGPLKSWNNGGAGKRLMGLLADGIRAGAPGVVSEMDSTIARITTPTTMPLAYAGGIADRGAELVAARQSRPIGGDVTASASSPIASAGRALHIHGPVLGDFDEFVQKVFDEWDRRDRRTLIRSNVLVGSN